MDYSHEHEPNQIGGGRDKEPEITWEEAYKRLGLLIFVSSDRSSLRFQLKLSICRYLGPAMLDLKELKHVYQ